MKAAHRQGCAPAKRLDASGDTRRIGGAGASSRTAIGSIRTNNQERRRKARENKTKSRGDGKQVDAEPVLLKDVQSEHVESAACDSSAATRTSAKPVADATDHAVTLESSPHLSHSQSQAQAQAIIRLALLPLSDRLDPFAALPIGSLSRFQEHLVSFYLLHYPQLTYGFSPHLRPHPVATNFSIALTTPACFQVALARAALYRLHLLTSATAGGAGTEAERKDLQLAVLRHKGEALRLVRALSVTTKPPIAASATATTMTTTTTTTTETTTETTTTMATRHEDDGKQSAAESKRKDDLLASIISLGTLDRRAGATDTAGMHYSAVRRILKATGGPLAVQSLLLSRVMVFFECIYGTSPESYIWDEADLGGLVEELNRFLEKAWRAREGRMEVCEDDIEIEKDDSPTGKEDQTQAVQVTQEGPKHGKEKKKKQKENDDEAKGRAGKENTRNKEKQPATLEFCLRSGSALYAVLSKQPGGENPPDEVTPLHRLELVCQLTCLLTLAAISLDFADDPQRLLSYTTRLEAMIEDLQLQGRGSNNVMWQIQINDHSDQHSRRIWHAASYAWVMKHCTYKVQTTVKEWLLSSLTGKEVERVFKLDPFHFSYAN